MGPLEVNRECVTRITQEHSQEWLCHERQDGGVKPPLQVELGLVG
jgi:hypothetical protein